MIENDDDGMVKTRVEEEDSNMRQQDEMNSKNSVYKLKTQIKTQIKTHIKSHEHKNHDDEDDDDIKSHEHINHDDEDDDDDEVSSRSAAGCIGSERRLTLTKCCVCARTRGSSCTRTHPCCTMTGHCHACSLFHRRGHRSRMRRRT